MEQNISKENGSITEHEEIRDLSGPEFKFSHLFIIDMLNKKDKIYQKNNDKECKEYINSAESLFLTLHSQEQSFKPLYCKIRNKPQLKKLLNKIENMAIEGFTPCLHFECHGLNNSLGFVISDIEAKMRWDELVPYFIKINRYTKNNLGLILACCKGLGIMQSVKIPMGSPFGFLIAAKKVVLERHIKNFSNFYNILYETKDISKATQCIRSKFKSYTSQEVFVIMTYFKLYSLKDNESRNSFKESLSNKLKENLSFADSTPIEAIMNEAEEKIKNIKCFYEFSARRFLHGAEPYSHEKVDAFLDKKKKRQIARASHVR